MGVAGLVLPMRPGATQALSHGGLVGAMRITDVNGDAISVRVLDVLTGTMFKGTQQVVGQNAAGTLNRNESWSYRAPTGRFGIVPMFTAVAVDAWGATSRPFVLSANLSNAATTRPLSMDDSGEAGSDEGESSWVIVPLSGPALRAVPAMSASVPSDRAAVSDELAFDLEALMNGRPVSGGLLSAVN